MADTSMVDLVSLIEMRSPVRLKRVATTDGGEFQGNCPFCGVGTNRFHCWPNSSTKGHYWCRVCDAKGDAVTFLQKWEDLNYFEACEELDIDPGSEYARRDFSALVSRRENPPSKDWQKQARAVIALAQNILKSKRGAHALEYLHNTRGFTDETIEKSGLGYIPLNAEGRWFMETFEQWGLKQEDYPDKKGVWLYEGILIPCYENDTIWKLTVRRLTGLKEGDPKYIDILGSGEGLFNVDAIQPGKPVALCEGPLDALAGAQQCSDMAAFVATGSVARGRTTRWEARLWLASPSPVLVAYDDDAPDKNGKRAGDEGAKYWLNALPHASQWMPWSHDINDMLTSGVDLRAWLQLGLDSAALEQDIIEDEAHQEPPIAPTEQEPPETVTPAQVETMQEGERRVPWPVAYDANLPCCRCGSETLVPTDGYPAWYPDWMCPCYFEMEQSLAEGRFRPRYAPATLPTLPRSSCPHEVMTTERGAKKCRAKTLAHGWCEEHASVQELLELGGMMGYPRFDCNEYRSIGEGIANWEAYATCAPEKWVKKDVTRLKIQQGKKVAV